METTDRSLARHQRIYRKLLLAYPRAFRQVYGADMVQVFGDRWRDAREQTGRGGGFRVWLSTLLDLFKSAPVQRMEKKMSREAGIAVLFALFMITAVALFAMGIGGLVINISLGALIIAAIALGASGAFRKDRARNAVPAGKIGARQWWVVLAAVMAVVEIVFVVGQLIQDPKIENVGALAIVGTFGLVALTGVWLRSRSRSSGDWMIVVGILPFAGLFWLIFPAVLAVIVITFAVIDSLKRAPDQTTTAPA
ncbi:MAG: hypothetical protein WD757_04405 [Actinomycetota bacterium]